IVEAPSSGGITTDPNSAATLTFTVNSTQEAVDLSAGANKLPAVVHVSVVGVAPTFGGLGFRNVNPASALSPGILSNYTTVSQLTVQFDNTSLDVHNLPAFTSGTNLQLTAGGPITQSSGVLTTTGSASFNVLGDFGINLPDINSISGPVSFSD